MYPFPWAWFWSWKSYHDPCIQRITLWFVPSFFIPNWSWSISICCSWTFLTFSLWSRFFYAIISRSILDVIRLVFDSFNASFDFLLLDVHLKFQNVVYNWAWVCSKFALTSRISLTRLSYLLSFASINAPKKVFIEDSCILINSFTSINICW